MKWAKEEKMISDLLSRYYEIHGTDPSFTIIQSFVVNGHEVAWVEYSGTVACDITGEGKEGQPYIGRELYCECNFKEGVGWQIHPEHGVEGIGWPEKCCFRKTVLRQRHKDLRKEFLLQFKRSIKKHTPEIILALIDKVKAGEFIENGSGASFWGGYFYLQTVAAITREAMFEIRKIVERMIKEKKIGLEGAIVTPYRKSPRAKWVEAFRFQINKNGWTVIASLPEHRQMKQVWKFKIVRSDGGVVRHNIPQLAILFDPIFGPDAEDVARAGNVLQRYLATDLSLEDVINKI